MVFKLGSQELPRSLGGDRMGALDFLPASIRPARRASLENTQLQEGSWGHHQVGGDCHPSPS